MIPDCESLFTLIRYKSSALFLAAQSLAGACLNLSGNKSRAHSCRDLHFTLDVGEGHAHSGLTLCLILKTYL